jgi:hypothetical protein
MWEKRPRGSGRGVANTETGGQGDSCSPADRTTPDDERSDKAVAGEGRNQVQTVHGTIR